MLGTAARGHGGTGRRILALAVPLFLCAPVPLLGQSWRSITSARQLHGERELTVNVRYGAGRFTLGPGTGSQLYRMELRYDEDKFIPVREYDVATPSIRLGVRSREGTRVSMGNTRRGEQPPFLDVLLTPDVPLVIDMELGAVQAEIEMGGLAIQRASYHTGASETRFRWSRPNPVPCEDLTLRAGAAEFTATQLGNSNCERVSFEGGLGEVTLDFSGSWRRSMIASVNMGIGSLQLRLPRDVGVAVTVSRFLASFDAAGFTKRGNTYYSANYNESRHRLTLDVNTSIGGIEVSWIN
jgi:hypothetical protein